METIPVLFRVRHPDGLVAAVGVEVPVRRGDEGFRVLALFEKHYGAKERDVERDRRLLELKARIAKGLA